LVVCARIAVWMANVVCAGLLFALLATAVFCNSCVYPPKSTGEWVQDGAPDPDMILRFTVSLHHRNVDILEKELLAISDPMNPRYGQFYTFDQVNELVAPSDEHVAAVVRWVENYDLPSFLREETMPTFTCPLWLRRNSLALSL